MMFVNLNEVKTVKSVRYLPPQNSKDGIITHYRISATTDWNNWTIISEGEFSNVINNPIWQTVKCNPTRASVIKFEGLNLSQGNRMAYSDIDIVTE